MSSRVPQVQSPFISQSVEDSWDLNGAVMPSVKTTKDFAGTSTTSGAVAQLGDPTQVQVDILQGGVLRQRKATVNEYTRPRQEAVSGRSVA